MKVFLYLLFSVFVFFCSAQTWQSALDSCLKYKKQQQYRKAIEWGDKALELYEKYVIVKDTNYANLLNTQFINCYEGGFYKSAEIYAKKDSIWAKENKDDIAYSTACNSLATLYEIQGKYTDAERMYKKVKEIRETILGKEHLLYASSCNNLAILYKNQGRYAEAEPLYKEAKQIRAKISGKESIEYASSCNNLALLYKVQGRYNEAEVLYKEAKDIFSKTIGINQSSYAVVCANLGNLYRYEGKYADAEPLLKEATETVVRVLNKSHPDYATYCNNLADLYYCQNKYADAELLYKEARENKSKSLGKQHPAYATTCNNLALLYQSEGKYAKAETLYKEAKEIYAAIMGKEHPYYAASCNKLASLYQIQGRYAEAESLYKESVKIKFKEIETNFKNLSESEKENYIKKNIERYFNDFQKFVYQRYKDNPALTEYAYKLTIETKGLILQSTQKVRNRILGSKDENLKNLYAEWKQTKDKYVKSLNLTIKQRKDKKINPDSLAQRVNELEKQIALKSEDFAKIFTPRLVTWKDIQNTLKKDQATIEIVRINASENEHDTKDNALYMALIIKKTSQYPEVAILPDGNELESKYLINYRRAVTTKVQDKESYNIFWNPIKAMLRGIKTVYFSPDGVYHQINLNTLQNPETKKYVFDEIQIINVTNTKDILEKKYLNSKINYLIGNPKFNLELDTKNNEKPFEQRSIENLSQLEGAEKEVKQISTVLPNAKTTFGTEATEEYVKYLKNPRILHVATHGYFKKEQYQSSTQAMLNAGLLFAGVIDYDRMDIRPFDKEDGKLTAFEVMNMELDSTELVVLSACETGLGKASKEGVYGLQRAFKVAGAECIIMSLWKVSDEATQLLMTKFYENWQKKSMDKRKAFETAQKEIRKQYKEPYYWGAFVMIE